jgi:hypothetical protein
MGLISITKLKLIEAEVECMKSERILISVSEKKKRKRSKRMHAGTSVPTLVKKANEKA